MYIQCTSCLKYQFKFLYIDGLCKEECSIRKSCEENFCAFYKSRMTFYKFKTGKKLKGSG